MYSVYAMSPDDGTEKRIVVGCRTVDDAVNTFIGHSRVSAPNTDDLLTTTQYVIDGENDKLAGFMVWAEVQGVGKPILVLQRYDRNVLFMYDINGRMIGKDKIT